MGGRRGFPLAPPPSSSFLSTARLFPSPLFPANLLLLKGPRFPSPPSVGGRGAAGLTPLPLGLSPLPSPAAPGLARAGLCARARWGEGSQPPPARLPRRNPARGGDGGGGRGPGAAVQTCFLPPAAAATRAPMCGCVPRPAHPPRPPARRVGAALKGLGAELQRLGIGAEEGGWGWGRGAECCRVSHVRATYSPAPTGSWAAGPWGQQEPPLARGGGRSAQTTPPHFPSLL